MTRRMKLILTRPSDNSLEAFVTFRKNTVLKLKDSNTILLKDDIVKEWEKFWELLNIQTSKKRNQIIQVN